MAGTRVPILNLTAGDVQASDLYPAVDVTDTTQAPDGTTKKYEIADLTDYIISQFGFTVYGNVLAATTVNLDAAYDNGISGVSATLTNSGAQTAFEIDDVEGVENGRYLIKNQTNGAENGIYSLTVVGDGSTNWILTRSSDFNEDTDPVDQGLVVVNYGTTNANTMWEVTFTTPAVMGTTIFTWSLFSLDPNQIFTWNTVSGASQAISNQNGYITSSASQTVFSLPASSSVGQIFEIVGVGAGGWKVTQGTNQYIIVGTLTSTTTSGYIESVESSAAIRVVCVASDVGYKVLSFSGNITVV